MIHGLHDHLGMFRSLSFVSRLLYVTLEAKGIPRSLGETDVAKAKAGHVALPSFSKDLIRKVPCTTHNIMRAYRVYHCKSMYAERRGNIKSALPDWLSYGPSCRLRR